MTYQAPNGWQFPGHGSHHAAPFGDSTPMRIHAHRALRLLAVAGAWAAGLFLVLGSMALVVKSTGPTSTTHLAAAARVHHLGPRQKLSGHSRPAGPVTHTFRGTGNRTTGQFTVAPNRRWDLSWSYACPARLSGHLLIREGAAGNAGISVSASGAAGSGRTSTYSRASAHYLVVITDCTWTIQVTGPR